MRKPHPGPDPPRSRRNKKDSTPPSWSPGHSRSDRLHLAMVFTLVMVTIVAVAFPITRSTASASEPTGAPVLVVADGVSATLYSQAQTVASALTQAAPTPTAQAPAISQSLDGFPAGALVPRSVLTAASYVLVQGALADPQGQQSLVMRLQEPVRFTLHEGAFASSVFSTRPTVGAALTALGFEYSPHDLVLPPPGTSLTAGLHVFVVSATAVDLSVGDDAPTTVYTHTETVADLLAERGVLLGEGDRVTPDLSTTLSDGLLISVTVVNEVVEYVETPTPFSTIYRDDPSLPEGEYIVAQYGVDGFVRTEYSVVYENGEEVSREVLSETVVAPTHLLIDQGTAVVAAPTAVAAVAAPPAPPSDGDPQCARTMNVYATWYTAASAGGSGYTATGTTVRKGTVAVDPSVIPMGTSMYIPGYGYGVAEDTGGAIKGNIIDLGYAANDVKDWRSGWVEICILN